MQGYENLSNQSRFWTLSNRANNSTNKQVKQVGKVGEQSGEEEDNQMSNWAKARPKE